MVTKTLRLSHMHRSSRMTSIIWAAAALAFILALVFAMPAAAGKWKGTEETRDGAKYILNPAEPMESPKTIQLEELWRVGGDTDNEDEFFGVISQILIDERGDVYILDMQLNQVGVYSEDGEFLRVVGREGEGPGEFRNPSGMFFTPSGEIGVIQTMPGKIVLLTKDGEPAGDFPLPSPEGAGFIVLVGGFAHGDNVVLQMADMGMGEGEWHQNRYLISVSPEGKELTRYFGNTRQIIFANPVMNDMDWDTFDRRWSIDAQGRVYAAVDYNEYQIHVWNADGSLDRVIQRDFESRKRTAEEIELITNLMGLFARQIPNCKVQVTDMAKDIDTFYIREDGSIWVLNAHGSYDNPEGSIGIFDVFDPDGHYVQQVTLEGEGDPKQDGYFFVKDRLYVVTDLVQAAISLQAQGESFQIGEEEPEPMAVIAYHLPGDVVSVRR